MDNKILFISGLQIYPVESGGQKRSSSICESLTQCGFEVTIFSLTGRRDAYLKLKGDTKFCANLNLTEFVYMNPVWGLICFLCYRLHIPFIWQSFVLKFLIPKKLRNLIDSHQTIILDFPYLYPIAQKSDHTKKFILNTHNAEFNLWDSGVFKKLVQIVESKAIDSCDTSIYCTEGDREALSKLCGRKLPGPIIPNGLNISELAKYDRTSLREEFRKKLDFREIDDVYIFSGSYFGPNIETLEFIKSFVTENFHVLKANNIKIVVLGSVSKASSQDEVLTITSRVDDVYPYLCAADKALNLVTSGSGANVKNYEYIYFELPIITTSVGARGLDLHSGNAIIIERDQLLDTMLNHSLNFSELSKNAYKQNIEMIDIKISIKKNLNIFKQGPSGSSQEIS
ncbi:MAG: hypothetical protein HOE90_05015 [Bacteriovoracaceae bacterium]|nr:hypothetical protein [Bacteriovoracaceae bacterium]